MTSSSLTRGRLIHQGAIGDLQRDGSGDVLVVTVEHDGDELVVQGLDAARVGEIADDERVVLHELSPRDGSLEEMFLHPDGDAWFGLLDAR